MFLQGKTTTFEGMRLLSLQNDNYETVPPLGKLSDLSIVIIATNIHIRISAFNVVSELSIVIIV